MNNITRLVKLLITLNIGKPEKRIIVGLLLFIILLFALPFLQVGNCTEKLLLIPFLVALFLVLSYLAHLIKSSSKKTIAPQIIDRVGIFAYICLIIFLLGSYAFDCTSIQSLFVKEKKEKEYIIIKVQEKCIPIVKKEIQKEILIKEITKKADCTIDLHITYCPIVINGGSPNADYVLAHFNFIQHYHYHNTFGFFRISILKSYTLFQNVFLSSLTTTQKDSVFRKNNLMNTISKYIAIRDIELKKDPFIGHLSKLDSFVFAKRDLLTPSVNVKVLEKKVEIPIIIRDTIGKRNDKELEELMMRVWMLRKDNEKQDSIIKRLGDSLDNCYRMKRR